MPSSSSRSSSPEPEPEPMKGVAGVVVAMVTGDLGVVVGMGVVTAWGQSNVGSNIVMCLSCVQGKLVSKRAL